MAFSDTLKKQQDEMKAAPARPAFSPPQAMRAGYLERRRSEVDLLLVSARAGEWKPIITVVNHVRGSGAMYGFPNIGDAANDLVKAIQNGDPDSPKLLEIYIKAINESYV